jgi:hypothetical protein
MATRPPSPTVTSTETPIGTFVNSACVGYVEPPADVVEQIRARVSALSTSLPRPFLTSLVTLKILAPEESALLMIYAGPEAVKAVNRVAKRLAQRYYILCTQQRGQ